jgi:hypothetical protein
MMQPAKIMALESWSLCDMVYGGLALDCEEPTPVIRLERAVATSCASAKPIGQGVDWISNPLGSASRKLSMFSTTAV